MIAADSRVVVVGRAARAASGQPDVNIVSCSCASVYRQLSSVGSVTLSVRIYVSCAPDNMLKIHMLEHFVQEEANGWVIVCVVEVMLSVLSYSKPHFLDIVHVSYNTLFLGYITDLT